MARVVKLALASTGTAIAMAVAFFLHPREGVRRRAAAGEVVRRESANVASLVGTAADSPSRRRYRNRADAELAGRVRVALEKGVGDGAGHLSVAVDRGVVGIRGEVDDISDIDRYEAVVRGVPGVRDVDNLLRVRVTEAAHSRALLA